MFFTRTYRYHSTASVHDIKNRLLGTNVKVHGLNFEVSEKEHILHIVPHEEQVNKAKTLPVTHVIFKDKGTKTQIVINSKMRTYDSSGPVLVVAFCALLFMAAVLFFIFGKEEYASFAYALVSISLLIFIIFWVRLESGYFDYVRKIRDYVRNAGKM